MASTEKMAHPRGLYTLFFTEMWERFSYYGMRALLVLYLTTEYLRGGFGMDRASALEIYGIFTGLAYLTPIIGGALADRILGQRRAIYIGGFLMALGQFALAGSHAFAADEALRRVA
jgi:POT family proton-dependent oligopeptide transporter